MLNDFGGPEVISARELAQTWLARRGMRKLIVGIPLPGQAARAFRAGHHLSPDHPHGQITWADWVERAYEGGRVPTAYGRKGRSA